MIHSAFEANERDALRVFAQGGLARLEARAIFLHGSRLVVAVAVIVADLRMRVDQEQFSGFAVFHGDDFPSNTYGRIVFALGVVILSNLIGGESVADPDRGSIQEVQWLGCGRIGVNQRPRGFLGLARKRQGLVVVA